MRESDSAPAMAVCRERREEAYLKVVPRGLHHHPQVVLGRKRERRGYMGGGQRCHAKRRNRPLIAGLVKVEAVGTLHVGARAAGGGGGGLRKSKLAPPPLPDLTSGPSSQLGLCMAPGWSARHVALSHCSCKTTHAGELGSVKHTVPSGTTVTRRPLTVVLNAVHCAGDGQHDCPGAHQAAAATVSAAEAAISFMVLRTKDEGTKCVRCGPH